MPSYCCGQLGHLPLVTSHSAERGKGMYHYSHLATKRNKKQEKSMYMTYVKICKPMAVDFLSRVLTLVLVCSVFVYFNKLVMQVVA
jgi:hypothetical protein